MHNLYLSINVLLVGALLIVLALPLFFKKIRPNGIYGIRIPKAFESEESWYRINKIVGGKVVAGGVVLVVAAIALLFSPEIHNKHYRMIVLLIAVFAAFIGGLSTKISSSDAVEHAVDE